MIKISFGGFLFSFFLIFQYRVDTDISTMGRGLSVLMPIDTGCNNVIPSCFKWARGIFSSESQLNFVMCNLKIPA